jgi:hypothetical protein
MEIFGSATVTLDDDAPSCALLYREHSPLAAKLTAWEFSPQPDIPLRATFAPEPFSLSLKV